LGAFSQFVQNFAFAADSDIPRLEIVLHVHAELAFRQVAHVADAGFHCISSAQKFADGAGLCRRLHDDEGSHGHPSLLAFASHYSVRKFRCKPAPARTARQSYAAKRPPGSWRTRPSTSSHVTAAAASSTGAPVRPASSSTDKGPASLRAAMN